MRFEKVSFAQFKKDWMDTFANGLFEDVDGDEVTTDDYVKEIYENIKLPKRATTGSAGYDFFTPVGFVLEPEKNIKIPTGIRCFMEDGYFLGIVPRSGLGFKYRLQLDNTFPVIDQDYVGSDNEGHIFIKMTNDSKEGKTVSTDQGDAFAQGIFMRYYTTEDDDATGIRNGGMGSTTKEK